MKPSAITLAPISQTKKIVKNKSADRSACARSDAASRRGESSARQTHEAMIIRMMVRSNKGLLTIAAHVLRTGWLGPNKQSE